MALVGGWIEDVRGIAFASALIDVKSPGLETFSVASSLAFSCLRIDPIWRQTIASASVLIDYSWWFASNPAFTFSGLRVDVPWWLTFTFTFLNIQIPILGTNLITFCLASACFGVDPIGRQALTLAGILINNPREITNNSTLALPCFGVDVSWGLAFTLALLNIEIPVFRTNFIAFFLALSSQRIDIVRGQAFTLTSFLINNPRELTLSLTLTLLRTRINISRRQTLTPASRVHGPWPIALECGARIDAFAGLGVNHPGSWAFLIFALALFCEGV